MRGLPRRQVLADQHVHALHATILDALGLDHTELIYRLQGRPERPTVNEGEVVTEVFA